MSATRLLVLGVVRGFGRAHGYLVNHELQDLLVKDWANIRSGSIYHALKQMTKEGLLRAIETDAWPGRIDYEVSEKGDEEFLRLLRDALRVSDYQPDTLAASVVLMPALRRDEAIALLKERLNEQEADRDELTELVAQVRRKEGRNHGQELLVLWLHSCERDADWTRGMIERLEAGAYVMAGEEGYEFGPGQWAVPTS